MAKGCIRAIISFGEVPSSTLQVTCGLDVGLRHKVAQLCTNYPDKAADLVTKDTEVPPRASFLSALHLQGLS